MSDGRIVMFSDDMKMQSRNLVDISVPRPVMTKCGLAPRTSLCAPVLGPAHGPMVNLPTHVAMYLHKQGMEII